MKTWLKIALLGGLCLGIAAFASYTITSDCEAVSQPLRQMEQALLSEDWQAAEQLFRDAERQWQHPDKIWPLLIDHEDSHDIEISFVNLRSALALRDADEARRELAALLYHIQHVRKHERISWQNIL